MGRLAGVQEGWTSPPAWVARIPGGRDREAPAFISRPAWGLRAWLSATFLKTDVMASVALGEGGWASQDKTCGRQRAEVGPRGNSGVPSSGHVPLNASPLPSDFPEPCRSIFT